MKKQSRLNRLAESLMKHIKQFEKEVREDECRVNDRVCQSFKASSGLPALIEKLEKG